MLKSNTRLQSEHQIGQKKIPATRNVDFFMANAHIKNNLAGVVKVVEQMVNV